MTKNGMFRLMQCKWELLFPLLACLLAFALRHHFLVTYHYPMMIHEQDAVGYMEVAKSFMHLRFPSVSGRPPGYPIVIALFAKLPVGLEYAARLASIFMDALVVLPLYYIARIYLSRAGALAACLLWAFFSFSLYFSTSPLSQSSYLCYLLFGVVFLYSGYVKKGLTGFFCSGIFMALSYLARPEGIVGFGYGLFFCLTLLMGKNGINRKNLLIPICYIIGFLLLAGPYLIAMRITLGGWTVSALTAAQVKSADTVLTLNAEGGLQKSVSTGLSAWKEYYTTLPMFVRAIQENFNGFMRVYVNTFPHWMNVVILLGFLLLVWKSAWRNTVLLLILIAVLAPTLVVNLPKSHSYIYPFFVMTFICFAFCFDSFVKGGVWIAEKFLPTVKSRFIGIFLSGLLLLPTIYVFFMFYQTADDSYQSPGLVREALETEQILKGAGEFIKNNSQVNDIIMTRWGLVGYFADRPVLTLPKGGVQEVIAYGRKNGARFVLIDTKSVFLRRQELLELLGPLAGKVINPAFGLEVFNFKYVQDLGGYVIYRYK